MLSRSKLHHNLKCMNIITAPFSFLYGSVLALRNWAFDRGMLTEHEFEIPIISVGNLSVGGTGKSPMIEYLITLLSHEYKVGVVSRGYGRKTKGYLEVNSEHTALEVGDEPLQFKRKFPEIKVAVCADRVAAIKTLTAHCEIILLDDAYQHRYVRPAINILLTQYHKPYHKDRVLPWGRLREWAKGARRADIVVVTKCPEHLAHAHGQSLQYDLKLSEDQSFYATSIDYSDNCIGPHEEIDIKDFAKLPFVLVTGIARPEPMVEKLKNLGAHFEHFSYSDHHNFSEPEIIKLRQQDLILTTEKDFQRLGNRLEKRAIYYWPIRTKFLFDRQQAFDLEILRRVAYHRSGKS